MIKGVILDLDGTLVDSNDAHAHAWADALREFGYDVGFEQIRKLIGMGGDNLMPAAVGVEEKSAEGQRISERRSAIFEARYQSQLQPFDKARALVQRLADAGLKLIAASSGEQEQVDANLKIADVADLVTMNTSADDTENSKPDPDIIEAALDKLDLQPDEVIMIGDTPYDIEAAAKCGVKVIAVRCGGFSDKALSAAVAIYDDPADLLQHLGDLVPNMHMLLGAKDNI